MSDWNPSQAAGLPTYLFRRVVDLFEKLCPPAARFPAAILSARQQQHQIYLVALLDVVHTSKLVAKRRLRVHILFKLVFFFYEKSP
jgi:hypothetical protein